MHVVRESATKVWFGGYGPEPYVYVVEKGSQKKFLGGSFVVETFADLEKYLALFGPYLILSESPAVIHAFPRRC